MSSRVTKRLLAVLIGLAFAVLLLVGAALVASHFLSTNEPLRTQLVEQLSRQIGGRARFQTLRLSVLPLPHITLERVNLSVPGAFEGAAASVSVYPRLLPLLSGKLQITEVRLASPDIRVTLPSRPAAQEVPPPGSFATEFQHSVVAALGAISSIAAGQAPGLVLVVQDGRVDLGTRGGVAFHLTDVLARVHLPPGRLSLDMSCASNLWEQMALQASVDATTFEGTGRIDLTRLRPQTVSSQFVPPGIQLNNFEMDLTLLLTAHGAEHLRVDADASLPALTLRHGHKVATLRGQQISATLRLEGDSTYATVSRWQLDYPRLQFSANASLAPGAARLEARATEVDVASLRQLATLVAGEVSPWRDIFDVLRGGTVPEITINSAGVSLSDLGQRGPLVIRGHLTDGRVHVPGIDLDLEHVTGDVGVAGGILTGERISAQTGKSSLAAGTLRLGLGGTDPELHADANVHADAAEAVAMIKRLAGSAVLQRELDRITDAGGTISGTLFLGGTTKHVTVTANATALDLSGRVQGTSLPLRVQGGRLSYQAGGIEGSDLRLTVGDSTISECRIRLGANAAGGLQFTAGKTRIVLNQAYPWLIASGWLPDSSWNPTSLSGSLVLESLSVSGPTAAPSKWRFELFGTARDLAIDAPRLRERLPIRYPVSLSNLRLQYQADTGTAFAAAVTAGQGLTGTVDLSWRGGDLDIKHLGLRDAQSDAVLTLRYTPKELSLRFKGHVQKTTLDKLIDTNLPGTSLRGDIRARIHPGQPTDSLLEGRLEAGEAIIPLPEGRSLRIERVAVNAVNGTTNVEGTLDGGWGSPVHLEGKVTQSPQAFVADLDLAAGHLDWTRIAPWLQSQDTTPRAEASAVSRWLPRGTLRVAAESFTYGELTWQPAHAALAFAPGMLTVKVTDANICGGISTPGTISWAADGLQLAFDAIAKDQPLDAFIRCLRKDDQFATGRYGLSAHVRAHGQPADLKRSLDGQLTFNAKTGRIYGMGLFAKVLSVLNVATGALTGLPDVAKDGLPYDSLAVQGDLKGDTLQVKEFALDGPTVKWAAEGSVNVFERTLDLTLLVAPLTNIDSVVSRIPVISGVLGGSLVSIPVKVTGSMDNPQVTPLPPSAVGKGLLRVMTRILKLPVTVIQPLLPDSVK